jgi:hypothetical protein
LQLEVFGFARRDISIALTPITNCVFDKHLSLAPNITALMKHMRASGRMHGLAHPGCSTAGAFFFFSGSASKSTQEGEQLRHARLVNCYSPARIYQRG